MRVFHVVCALAALAAMSSTAFAAGGKMMNAMSAGKSVTVTMTAENNSKENGTATLTQKGTAVLVVVNLKNAPATAQPAHIHNGTCSKLNPVPKYPLSNVVNGKSTTMLKGMSLSTLSNGKFAINVHKSTNDLNTYVSCGPIK
jgi:hypothetical protein